MIGPVLHQELLLGGRRNRLHVLRWLYASWLVLLLGFLYVEFLTEESAVAGVRLRGPAQAVDRHASAPEVVGARFAERFVWQQSLFVFLTVPLFTAGALVDEKRRGTLQYLLLSDLEPRHILLGKLLGRLVVVGGWFLAGLPLFALMAGFGGVEPLPLLLTIAGLLPPIAAVAALSLLASVWCRQTRDAVLLSYLILLAGGGLVVLAGGPLRHLDPLWVLEPAWRPPGSLDPGEALRRLAIASAAWATIGTALLIGATLLLPGMYIKEIESVGLSRPGRFAARGPVGDDPVRWREQVIEGLAINATVRRLPVAVGVGLVFTATVASSLTLLYVALPAGTGLLDLAEAALNLNLRQAAALLPDAGTGFLVQGILVAFLASLVVGIRCAGSITQEREQHTWEALLLTPLSAGQIVRGKHWGVIRASGGYLLAYAAPAVALAALGGPVALLNTLLWLGVAGLAMDFTGAAGLWCSARARDSWRAVLATVAVGYLSAVVIYLVTSPAILVLALLLVMLLVFVDLAAGTNLSGLCMAGLPAFLSVYWTASAVALVLIFWLMARFFQKQARGWIADRDRTRSWRDEPYRPRRGRAAGPRLAP